MTGTTPPVTHRHIQAGRGRGRFLGTNAFRTEEAVQRFVPWIVGTFFAFR